MNEASLKPAGADAGGGRFVLSGSVGFATAGELLEASHGLFAGHDTVIVDLGGVDRADSAALALLLEWLRQARAGRRSLSFTGVPDKLRALAKLSGVAEILPVGAGQPDGAQSGDSPGSAASSAGGNPSSSSSKSSS